MARNGGKESVAGRSVSELVNDWDVTESTVGRVVDLLIALIVLCVLLSWSLVTFTVRQHFLSIIVVPLLIYFTLSSPGFRLRFRERLSGLLATDIMAVLNIAVFCIFMDHSFSSQESSALPGISFALAGMILMVSYLCRARFMYYLVVPFFAVANVGLLYLWGWGMFYAILLGLLVPLPFCVCVVPHPFYFGIGRVLIRGRYRNYPEPIARRIREKQKEECLALDREIGENERKRRGERRARRKAG